MPRKINRRAERIAVYLLPHIQHDQTVIAAWHAAKNTDRAPEIFRRALSLGLRAMYEQGELSDMLLNQGGLRARLAGESARNGLPAAFAPPPPVAPAAPVLSSPQRSTESIPVPVLTRPEPEPAEDEEPDFEALMGMMGGSEPMLREDA